MSDEQIIQSILIQAHACEAMGSRFSSALLNLAADDVARSGPTRCLFAPWRDAQARAIIGDPAPLRFLGALHERAPRAASSAPAARYPAADRAGDAALARREAPTLEPAPPTHFMTAEPQTNA